MRANQLRLWFASFAYVLLEALRRIGLRHTQFAAATCGTCLAPRGDHRRSPRSGKRLKLLKIGAQVRLSVRRLKVAMASAFPYQAEYHLAYLYLKRRRLLSPRHTVRRPRAIKIPPPRPPLLLNSAPVPCHRRSGCKPPHPLHL
jgi:Transposase DDE domain group 1